MGSGKVPGRVFDETDDAARLISETEEEYYPAEDTSAFEDALCYQATRPAHLEAMVACLDLKPEDVFVDYGCGKGRVACYVAMLPLRKVIGVELRRELVEDARRTIRLLSPPTPVEIVHADAAEFYTEEGTVFYLFNPFGARTVRRVLENIRRGLIVRPRPVRVVYNNCVHGKSLDVLPWLMRAGQVKGTDIWIWKNTLFTGEEG